jgi:type IV pilus assembly protein PilV
VSTFKHARQHITAAATRAQAGAAMIDALIAMVLISMWMLATAGLQLNSFKFQKGASHRFTAIALASELAERMEANKKGAQSGKYVLPARKTATNSSSDCNKRHCTPAELASFDFEEWTSRVVKSLPLNQVGVTSSTGANGLITYTIRLSWNERRGNQTYESAGNSETMTFELIKMVRP